jgi:hypothetical protein
MENKTDRSKFTSLMIDRDTKAELKRIMDDSGCKNYPELLRRLIYIYDKVNHLPITFGTRD